MIAVAELDETFVNVSEYVRHVAREIPGQKAIIVPGPRDRSTGKRSYSSMTFAEVERDIDLLARGLTALGVARGTRTLMLVKPSFEFFTLSFALFRIGAVPVMLDPGMGRERVLGAILEVEPEAMIGIPKAHLARILFPRAFASVKIRVSTGWFGGRTLDEVRALGAKSPAIETARTQNEDVAAILFTSGSTGAPKGVIYTHGIFDEQVRIFREDLGIRRGEVDLSAFPLFSLFSTALGASVIVPDMDATRPAAVDPALIAESITDCDVTYAFGSPAFWRRIADHCEANKLVFTTLKRILMAGAPAPAALLARLVRTVPSDSEVYTPYGATESLPISLPTARELSGVEGAGTCVGKPLARATVKIIAVSDDPIAMISNARELPVEEIGEICVKSAMTTRSYFRRPLDDAKSKIRDGHEVWHRMGDVGFFDRQGRLWFCGRKSHRVETSNGPMFTENVEKLFNAHPAVFRSALVGVGERGSQKPVIIIELEPGASATEQEMLDLAKRSETTRAIEKVLFHPSLPVDPRHNAKIIREELAVWAAAR